MKPVCVTFAWGDYKNRHIIYDNCISSFKKWHPGVELRVVTDEEPEIDTINGHSIFRINYVIRLFDEGYTKVVMIGLDTFACAYWNDIFDENDNYDIVTVLNGGFCLDHDVKLKQVFSPMHNLYENMSVCCDMTCYNTRDAARDIRQIIHTSGRSDNFAVEKYANELNHDKCKVLNFPYVFSMDIYYCKASWPGILGSDCILPDGKIRWGIGGPVIGEFSPTTVWKPIGDKLYNHIGKHVKSLCYDKTVTKDNIHHYLNKECIEWFSKFCDVDFTL